MMRRLLLLLAIETSRLREHRRAWLVAVFAPLVMVPLAALVLGQFGQLGEARRHPAATVGVAGLPQELVQRLREARLSGDGESARESLVPLDPAAATRLVMRLDALDKASTAEDTRTPDDARRRAWRQEVLADLRHLGLSAAVVALPAAKDREPRVVVALDDAHPEAPGVRQDLDAGLSDHAHDLTVQRLERLGLSAAVLDNLDHRIIAVAPEDEVERCVQAPLIAVLTVALVLIAALPLAGLLGGGNGLVMAGILPDTRRELLAVRWVAASLAIALSAASLATGSALAWSMAGSWLLHSQDPQTVAGMGMLALPAVLAVVPGLAMAVSAALIALRTLSDDGRDLPAFMVPLALLALGLAAAAAIDGLEASLLTDLLPIAGLTLAVKAALQGSWPWLHLGLATAVHLALAILLLGWAGRRLADDHSHLPPACEALVVFAGAELSFTLAAPLFTPLDEAWQVTGPLVLGVAAVVAGHAVVRRLDLARDWSLTWPRWPWLLRALCAAPWLALVGTAIGSLQPEPPADLGTGTEILDNVGHLHWTVALACVAVAPGICEELLCRGTVLSFLRRSLGPVMAVLASSLLFALMHGSPWRFLPQFAVGIVLAMLTLRSGSIIPAMLLHAGYNAALWAVELHQERVLLLPGAQTVADLPPLALLGAGLLGVFATVGWGGSRFDRGADSHRHGRSTPVGRSTTD